MGIRSLVVFLPFLLVLPACGDDGGSDGEMGEGVAYRISSMQLLDPHAIVFIDVTGTVNTEIDKGLTMDMEPVDGLLDVSLLLVFPSPEQSPGEVDVEFAFPECTAPVETTSCSLPSGGDTTAVVATNMANTCLEAVAGTTGDYGPPVESVIGPCFTTAAQSLDVSMGSFSVPLIDAQVSATYEGNAQLTGGLMRGYLTQEAADATILPDALPIVGGEPLSTMLSDADKDTGPSGEEGWWFYLSFTAEAVGYTAP